jgi:lysophospholipase L1-like esterase
MTRVWLRRCWLTCLLVLLAGTGGGAQSPAPGLLFYLSASHSLTADWAAGGDPEPNFASDVQVVADGAIGPGVQCGHTQVFSYRAPGNIYAERGTLAFFWRSREAVAGTPFPVFRVGYGDHSSWDMTWMRIDYNGKPGFDAFVTDANLARTRVSYAMPGFPGPKQWVHLALAWDETRGIRFYVNGQMVASQDGQAIFSAALDQFGPHSRVISPYQVQSAYNFVRGGDIDELRIYDRMIGDENVAALARGDASGAMPPLNRTLAERQWRDQWWYQYGWNRAGDPPPALDAQAVRIRKVEIHDVYDVKRWWWKGTDGIRETTWPGVYNRSRLPGRNDYFQLPDWDCYSVSGESVQFAMPDEPWNHLEVSGAAFGSFALVPSGVKPPDPTAPPSTGRPVEVTPLFERPKGQERTFHRLDRPVTGLQVRFTNVERETPIGEFAAYYVGAGNEPAGTAVLSYRLTAQVEPRYPSVQQALTFLNGRYPTDARTTMVGLPAGSGVPRISRGPQPAGLPIVHILIPSDFRDAPFGAWRGNNSYTWTNLDGGLDGIAIDLPPLKVLPTHGELFPINISVRDPLWPLRSMLDFSFTVRPGEAHTLWLDLRDRILPRGAGLYLTMAGAGGDFGSAALEGAAVRLIFKSAKAAKAEHVLDRFTQVRDNFAHIIEERPNTRRLSLYTRFETDLTDLLAVDPENPRGREYWYEYNREQPRPEIPLSPTPPGTPRWAARQVEYLRYVKRFVNWFIDHRQLANGEFGGGLSDDGDLTNWWPGTAMMGVAPERIRASLLRELDAFYDQGMFANGLSTIQTDELHSYEEGIQVLGQALLLDFGGPQSLERAMETARAIEERITAINAAGHRHITSSYFSGTRVATDGVWGWSKPSSYLILHPAIALVDYNGAPRVKRWLVELADGLLAHYKPDGTGGRVLRAAVRFETDEDQAAAGSDRTWPLLWAVYRWTGDRKYLAPILDAGIRGLPGVAANALDLLSLRRSLGPQILAAAKTGSDPSIQHLAWQVSGDRGWLEALYEDQIQAAAAREYINTQGSLWTDRSSINHAELQRARLGGVALTRNAYEPGQAISWTFSGTRDDERVAVLVPDATPTHLRVVAWNLGATPVLARMRGWDIEPGSWKLTQATGPDPDALPGDGAASRAIEWERSRELEVSLAPGVATVLEFTLVKKGVPYWTRPDLGIGDKDVQTSGRRMTVTVHSLGAVAAPPSRLVVRDRFGAELARARVPAIKAPSELKPVAALVRLSLPAGANLDRASVTIETDSSVPEITQMNNRVRLPRPPPDPAVRERPPTDPALRDPELPTLFIVGDSTVKNHGAGDGWGDFIAPHFDERGIQVLNWAMGGRSARSFVEDGRWARVLAQMKAGDFVLIQFGHNDQSEITMDRGTLAGSGEERERVYADSTGRPVTVSTFGHYLRQYLRDVRARGATAMLCTPVPRNYWLDDGRFNNVMAEHAALVRRIAGEEGVGVLDLNETLAASYVALGPAAVSSRYFTVGDDTHTNGAGAEASAEQVVKGIQALGGHGLAAHLKAKRQVHPLNGGNE